MSEIMKREDVVEQMVEFELERIEWDTVADILENGYLGEREQGRVLEAFGKYMINEF